MLAYIFYTTFLNRISQRRRSNILADYKFTILVYNVVTII